ncbi:MAG: ATP phosphoribosyltransferase [Candidatus Peregrinibacteria bacterium GW2011_GWA2_47_7]|nr:MAG: ATP phosphoribosyltransferase [Candidatus Peregrinibacteria bacterium GW2011_GWA2_47_7]
MKTLQTTQFAVQSNGRLTRESLDYLRAIGLTFEENGRSLITSCQNQPVDILYLRSSDIPEYVSRGVASFGIVGENVLYEKRARVKIVRRLGFAMCSLVIAVPKGSPIKTLQDLEGERIATSYPRILREFLNKKKINAAIISIQGSVEITPSVNLADAVCDLVQSGRTLRENNLTPIQKVLDSEAVLIASPEMDTTRASSIINYV